MYCSPVMNDSFVETSMTKISKTPLGAEQNRYIKVQKPVRF
ncbi:hypothetical protein SAMN04488541_101410 [Thermoflexibacter ruber]|uniref:Uncharacterized protein n=1 Tax=Thermoflexibacter ruber TaxID=1003 RepID=A0A1I2FK86_9BACT|nr:hypothetical protein SAMN04488541_101410 [Thermoflexibacter ruber]